jgi:hypothetical protein
MCSVHDPDNLFGRQATSISAMKDMAASIPGCQYRELATENLAPLEDPAGIAGAIRDFANGLL